MDVHDGPPPSRGVGDDPRVRAEGEDENDSRRPHDGLVSGELLSGVPLSNTSPQSFTPRSLLVGLAIGTLITFSNTYFGLQTGWISVMTMPSSLIGFAVFKSLSRHLSFPFTPVENVLVQTVAGAVGTMPLGCGFVGVIPALEFLLQESDDGDNGGEGPPLKLGFGKLLVWSLGVCLFGVVFAVPLRREVIVREKLKFPSGTATALMIRVLHGGGEKDEKAKSGAENAEADGQEGETERLLARQSYEGSTDLVPKHVPEQKDARQDWKANIRLLVLAFAISAFYTLFSYFVPQIRDLPIFGLSLAADWLWTLNPSPAYVGQGIIMGPSTSLHMLIGAVIGWGILSPLAKSRGWASGPVDDWSHGSKGWIVWVSLAIMLADSIINLAWLAFKPLVWRAQTLLSQPKGSWSAALNRFASSNAGRYRPVGDATLSSSRNALDSDNEDEDKSDDDDDAPPSQLISTRTVVILLPLTLILNVVCMHIAFGDLISPLLSTLATGLALLLSIMGVRAMGETDLNPVSGISKLTQLIFSLATPASHFSRRTAVVTNLLAGAVSESGALQAGDMMQDLKTGHLLGASPKAQFYGQLIGSLFGAVVSVAVYKLYVNVYDVPGSMFQIPTAFVWIFTARLVTGQGLPPMAWQASMIAGVIFAITTILRISGTGTAAGRRTAPWRDWIPGGIAVAVGMYNVPSFTLARAIGGLIAWWWARRHQHGQSAASATTMTAAAGNADANATGDGEADTGADANAYTRERAATTADESEQAGKDRSSSTVVVLASGLILGEGVVSIFNLVLASLKVPHL